MTDVALNCQIAGQTQDLFVSSGFVRERQRGAWTAYLESSSPLAPPEMSPAQVLIRREDGTADLFQGTVRRAKRNPGNERLAVTVVGGAGKLLAPLRPLDHVLGPQELPAGAIARAIADDAGELLADGVEAALDGILLPRWHRATDTTGAVALDLLADELGFAWRVLRNGKIWLGAETWVTVSSSAAGAYWTGLVEDDGSALYSVRGAPFLPGQALDVGPPGAPDVRQLVDVRYAVGGSALTVEVRSAVAGDPPHVPDLDLYRGSYAAEVKLQRADGSIDVTCDDARIGDLCQLELRVGIPGALVTVPTGARVRVRFEGASPKGAFAEGLDQDPTAAAPFALVGDGLSLGTLDGTADLVTGIVSFTFMPFHGPASFGTLVTLSGQVFGPGHKYAKGVSG